MNDDRRARACGRKDLLPAGARGRVESGSDERLCGSGSYQLATGIPLAPVDDCHNPHPLTMADTAVTYARLDVTRLLGPTLIA